MAAPFITLGLKGADALIEKHFHKVPHKYLYADTYKPAALNKKQKKKHRGRNSDSSSSSGDESDSDTKDRDMQGYTDRFSRDRDEGSYSSYSQGTPYMPPPQDTPFSREPPHMRPQYAPSPPPMGHPYAYGAPPPFDSSDTRTRDHRRSSYDDGDYHSDSYRPSRSSRRPKAVTRRSSSYAGPRSRYDDDRSQVSQASKRTGSSHLDRARDRAHRYGVKDEINDLFTSSKKGLAGSALGAVVGGWAAEKAQVAYGKSGRKVGNPLLTVLGAAAAGLAVNAAVDKWEEAQSVTQDEQEDWDKKFPDHNSRDGDKDSKTSRSRNSRRHGGYESDDYSD